MNDKMYEYLLEHNYISRNKNKSSFRQQELSENRAQCIACKCNSLFEEENKKLKEQLQQRDEVIEKASQLLEFYLIGNLKYNTESQIAFNKLLDILNNKGDNK